MSYTRADLKTRINAGVKGKIGVLISPEDTINQAVRDVYALVDLRSAKRRVSISPGLFTDVFSYTCPSDLNNQSVIDINLQVNRPYNSDYFLVTTEEFYRRKDSRSIAIETHDQLTRILVNAQVPDHTLIVSPLDSTISGGGTWVASGDATNITANTDNYVKGNASLSFDINSSANTTAGIKDTGLNTFNITDYRNSSVFVWAYIVSVTGITNYVLKIGNNTSNYLMSTVTTTHEGTVFSTGWNLLRFDLSSATVVGTLTLSTFSYSEIYMTKAITKIGETGYLFDQIQIKKGQIADLTYYSAYPWTSSAGAYKLSSTSDSDIIIADSGEFNLMVYKGIELAAAEMDEDAIEKKAQGRFKEQIEEYTSSNASEAKLLTSTYYDFIKQ